MAPFLQKNVGASIKEPSLVTTSAQSEGQKMASQSARSPPCLSPTGSLYTQPPSLSLPLLQDRKVGGAAFYTTQSQMAHFSNIMEHTAYVVLCYIIVSLIESQNAK